MENEPAATIAKLGLTVDSVFVPFSQSRNAKADAKLDDLSLNWKCTISRNGKPFLTTDYQQGMGFAPAYQRATKDRDPKRLSVDDYKAVLAEAETGRSLFSRLPTPKADEVLYCLESDAGALDFASFEDWAGDFGYETDSRKAESIYRACLDTGLKLRAALGEDGLAQLRAAFAEY